MITLKELIDNEEKVNKKFCDINKINLPFNGDFYDVLLPFFNDNIFIENALKAIKEVLVWEKKDVDIILILTDFLFSVVENGFLNRNMELSYKFSRETHINFIINRAKINTFMGIDFYAYVNIHKRILISMRLNGVINRKIVKISWDGVFTTTAIYVINIKCVEIKNFIIAKNPYKIYNFSCDFSIQMSCFRLTHSIIRKKRELEYFSAPLSGIEKSNTIEFIFDKELINVNSKLLDEYKNVLLDELNCKNIEEYYRKLEMVFEDLKFMKKWVMECVWNSDGNDAPKSMDDFLKALLKEKDGLTGRIMEILMLTRIEHLKGISFYLPNYIDNRGRQYYGNWNSLSFYKTLRFLVEFKKKNRINDSLLNSKYYKKISKYKHMVDSYDGDDIKKYFLMVLFIEVGKFFMEKRVGVKTEEIISVGMKNYKLKSMKNDVHDNMYLKKIYLTIDLFLENIYKDVIIFKDATASGLQNFGIILGYKKDKLGILNLNGDDWNDTYTYSIDAFWPRDKRIFIVCEDGTIIIIERKDIKQTVMVIPYGGSWWTCFNYFKEALKKKIDYNKLNEELKNDLKNAHKTFYENIKNNIKNDLYENKTNDRMIEFRYNDWIIVSINEQKITYRGTRDKYTYTTQTGFYNEKKSEKAKEANNMHYLDAKLVRHILSKIDVMCIHDCFGVSIFNLHILMDEVNEYYSKYINHLRDEGEEFYGLHVLI